MTKVKGRGERAGEGVALQVERQGQSGGGGEGLG